MSLRLFNLNARFPYLEILFKQIRFLWMSLSCLMVCLFAIGKDLFEGKKRRSEKSNGLNNSFLQKMAVYTGFDELRLPLRSLLHLFHNDRIHRSWFQRNILINHFARLEYRRVSIDQSSDSLNTYQFKKDNSTYIHSISARFRFC